MTIATVTSKGQTTIPKEIREQAGLQPGDRIHFTVIDGGAIMLRIKRRSIGDIKGLLKPRRKLRTAELSR